MERPERIILVAAHDLDRGIGRAGALPDWRLPSDMRRFRRLTMGLPCVMGRVTFESLPRPLQGRRNLVISRAPLPPQAAAAGAEWFGSLDAALASCRQVAVVIGGAQVYAQALPLATHAEITVVQGRFDADTWMPPLSGWQEVRRSEHHDPADSHATTWVSLQAPARQ